MPVRILLGSLAALLIGSLAVATFWPNGAAPSGADMQRAEVAAMPAADVDAAPASRAIFPKVLHR